MNRGLKWTASACVATGCVIGSLIIGMGAAVATTAATPTTATPVTASPATTTATPTTLTPTTGSPTTVATPTTAPVLTDPFQPPSTAATAHVSIVDFGYSPASITVTMGTTVTWTNTGGVIHSVTSDTGAFDSSPSCPSGACIDPGSSYSHTFATAGTFAYHCRVHSNMHGTIIVKAAVTTPTTTPGSTVAGGGGGASTSVAAQASGPQLAFTGAAANELWIAIGALFTITLGLALRPRRRPFPVPAEHRRAR